MNLTPPCRVAFPSADFDPMATKPSSTITAHDAEVSFRLLVESIKDYAIFMLDPEGRVTTWNRGAELIKGYRAKEIVGRHFSRFYPPEDIQARKPERALEAATTGGRFEDEGWRVRKDGSRFWASVVITACGAAKCGPASWWTA